VADPGGYLSYLRPMRRPAIQAPAGAKMKTRSATPVGRPMPQILHFHGLAASRGHGAVFRPGADISDGPRYVQFKCASPASVINSLHPPPAG
jgi:hypothetical protein